jgi:hypothetical protein
MATNIINAAYNFLKKQKTASSSLHYMVDPVPGIYSATPAGTFLVYIKPNGEDVDNILQPRMGVDATKDVPGICYQLQRASLSTLNICSYDILTRLEPSTWDDKINDNLSTALTLYDEDFLNSFVMGNSYNNLSGVLSSTATTFSEPTCPVRFQNPAASRQHLRKTHNKHHLICKSTASAT